MVDHVIAAQTAVVTMDTPLDGIVWPWLVTMNMWAKSIGTGVLLLGFYLFKKYPDSTNSLKISIPLVSFIFLNVFLLFTLLDLHQPFRMLNIFLHSHWTSPIAIGAWMASGLVGLVSLMVYATLLKKDTALFDKLLAPTVILAVPVTLYTAVLMGMSTGRELWQTPAELAQMMLAALLAGSATLLLIGRSMEESAKRDMQVVLGISALAMFTIFIGEYVFGPMKADEVAITLQAIKGDGEYKIMFWSAMVIGFVIPTVLMYLGWKKRTESFNMMAAVFALFGLWLAKHVWLIIPQLLPMS